MSKLETNTIDNISGSSTLTIGSTNTSTITLKSGATLTNFPDNTPAFKAKSASSQAVTESANNLVVLGTEVFDTDSAFSSNRFTVPTGEGGKYFFSAGLGTNQAIDDNKTFILKLHKNGSEILDGFTKLRGTSANIDPCITMTCILDLSASDYVELYFYTNNSNTNVEIQGDARTFLSGYKLIGV
tara:strand:- start:38 stop:592 length:555 start_codon:yes stop_codon:yes gene_type:complete